MPLPQPLTNNSMFEKLTLNDPVFNVQETHLNPPETHLNPPCEGGLGNSTDNEVRSIQAPSLTGRDGVGLGNVQSYIIIN